MNEKLIQYCCDFIFLKNFIFTNNIEIKIITFKI